MVLIIPSKIVDEVNNCRYERRYTCPICLSNKGLGMNDAAVQLVIKALDEASVSIRGELDVVAIQAQTVAVMAGWEEPVRTADYPVGLIVNGSVPYALLG